MRRTDFRDRQTNAVDANGIAQRNIFRNKPGGDGQFDRLAGAVYTCHFSHRFNNAGKHNLLCYLRL